MSQVWYDTDHGENISISNIFFFLLFNDKKIMILQTFHNSLFHSFILFCFISSVKMLEKICRLYKNKTTKNN